MSSQEATQRGDLDEVKTELERDPGAINDTDEDGYTACMFGAARGYADIVDFLIRNRADPNIQISAGSPGTPGGAPSETVRDAFLAHGLIQPLTAPACACAGGPNRPAHGGPVRPHGHRER